MKSQAEQHSTWVIIEYSDLINGKDLKPQIEKAYGPQGHGILFVKGIPGYSQQRRITLKLINQLAHLPKNILQKYQRPQIFHSLGWSHGVEKFQGQVDNSKASYYFNPTTDKAYQVKPQQQTYFTQKEKKFFNSNIWVDQIPKLQENVKKLSKQMIEVGTLLAVHIDDYAHSKVNTYPEKHLHNIIKNSNSHFGRMLHYFPYDKKGQSEDNWCGWHNDHGALTALTSASYNDQNGNEIDFKLKTGGLYAKNRFADKVRIPIPPQMLAFQLGQSMQILSGGCLEATPHCVIQSDQLVGKNISRNALVIFMQSGPIQVMKVPQGVDPRNVIEKEAYKVSPLGKRWQNGMLFKKFHQNTLQTYN